MIAEQWSKFKNKKKSRFVTMKTSLSNLIKISSINAFVKSSAFHVFFDEMYKLNLI
jgi:hypothetical protein